MVTWFPMSTLAGKPDSRVATVEMTAWSCTFVTAPIFTLFRSPAGQGFGLRLGWVGSEEEGLGVGDSKPPVARPPHRNTQPTQTTNKARQRNRNRNAARCDAIATHL
jgi:hypothetical protein